MNSTLVQTLSVAILAAWAFVPRVALSDETKAAAPIVVTIENHVFHPTEIHIPSHQKAEIIVKNLDPTAEEFESAALKVEKVVTANSQAIVRIRPMDHGHYTFVGEYHEKTARGVLVAD